MLTADNSVSAMSGVRMPSANAAATAFSMLFASSSSPKEYLSIIALLRIDAIGFAIFMPAISGADP